MEFKLETPKQHVSFFKFKFVKHFIQNEETKKIIPFYHLTEKYLMRSESILNSVSILSSHILNNMGFFLLLDDKTKQRYKVKINSIQESDPYQIKKEKNSGDISNFPPFK